MCLSPRVEDKKSETNKPFISEIIESTCVCICIRIVYNTSTFCDGLTQVWIHAWLSILKWPWVKSYLVGCWINILSSGLKNNYKTLRCAGIRQENYLDSLRYQISDCLAKEKRTEKLNPCLVKKIIANNFAHREQYIGNGPQVKEGDYTAEQSGNQTLEKHENC